MLKRAHGRRCMEMEMKANEFLLLYSKQFGSQTTLINWSGSSINLSWSFSFLLLHILPLSLSFSLSPSHTLSTLSSVWPDVEMKRSLNFTISSLKRSQSSFYLKGIFFKRSPKAQHIFVQRKWKNMSPKTFQNRPIWSHCLAYLSLKKHILSEFTHSCFDVNDCKHDLFFFFWHLYCFLDPRYKLIRI